MASPNFTKIVTVPLLIVVSVLLVMRLTETPLNLDDDTELLLDDNVVDSRPENVEEQIHENVVVPKPAIVERPTKTLSKSKNKESKFEWKQLITSQGIKIGTGTESNCSGLFLDIAKDDMDMPLVYREERQELDKHLNKVIADYNAKTKGKKERAEGHSGWFREERYFYWTLASHPKLKTVCEIGFNAGHSTLVWLLANPNTKVYAFDINRWNYTGNMVKYLKKKFPGRLQEYFGDSLLTIPKVGKQKKIKCDIAIVDGGHFYDVPIRDMVSMKLLSHPDTLMLVDDTARGAQSVETVMSAIETLEGVDFIRRIFMCSTQRRTGFAAFSYTWK